MAGVEEGRNLPSFLSFLRYDLQTRPSFLRVSQGAALLGSRSETAKSRRTGVARKFPTTGRILQESQTPRQNKLWLKMLAFGRIYEPPRGASV